MVRFNGKLRAFGALFIWVLFTVIAAYGQTGTIIKTIPAPNYPYGIAFDGTDLWVGTSSTNDDKIWRISANDGAVLGSITVPFVPPTGSYRVRGLAFEGAYLWVFMDLPSANHPDKFYKMDPATGAVLKTLDSPENNYIGGMSYFNDHIYYTQYFANNNNGKDVIIKMDTLGVPVDTIISVGEQPQGIAYNGQFIWCAEDTGFGATRQEIYEYDLATGAYTGNFIRNPTASPRDMTFDGQYFWLVHYNNTNSLLYQFDTRGGTPNMNVTTNNINFAFMEIGQTKSLFLGLSNPGTAPLTIDTLDFGNAAFSSSLSGFPIVLAQDSSLNINVHFTPTGYGTINSTLDIHSDDPVSPVVTIDLQGKGLFPDPTASLSAASHDFGNVWLSSEGVGHWKMDIINRGFPPLTVNGLTLSSSVFSVLAPDLPFDIGLDDTVTVTVLFTPDAAMTFQDTLRVSTNDPAMPVVSVALSGTGMGGVFGTGYQFWNYQVPENPAAGSFQDLEVDAISPMNDITGDGVSEVVIATENYLILCLNGASSGFADTLWSFTSYISNFSAGSIGGTNDFGVQDAMSIASDLNGDGYNDVVIGTGGGNEHVYAIDGTNGNMLWEFGTNDPGSFGLGDFEAVDAQRDFNNDGVPDVLAIAGGNETNTGYKSAYLFNGSDGAMIWDYTYPGPPLSFGKTVISVDDVNGDNVPDAIIGVGNNASDDKKAYCLDGGTGLPVWDFPATTADYNPKEILELPLNGETPDVIIAEYFNKVHRVDGETGFAMWTRDFGGLSGILQMDLISDVNGDSIADVLVASFYNGGAACLSGADGAIIWNYPMEFQYGIAAVPDLNRDGIEDVWVGVGSPSNVGEAFYISGLGDSLMFHQTFNGDRVISVNVMPSIDGNNTSELILGTREGKVMAFSGGEQLTGIDDKPTPIAKDFALSQNYPNPFNPTTMIRFQLAEALPVYLEIFNVTGQKVLTAIDGVPHATGNHQFKFDGRNLSSGIYFYRISAGKFVQTRKMVLMR